jgi:hypothetical protein
MFGIFIHDPTYQGTTGRAPKCTSTKITLLLALLTTVGVFLLVGSVWIWPHRVKPLTAAMAVGGCGLVLSFIFLVSAVFAAARYRGSYWPPYLRLMVFATNGLVLVVSIFVRVIGPVRN